MGKEKKSFKYPQEMVQRWEDFAQAVARAIDKNPLMVEEILARQSEVDPGTPKTEKAFRASIQRIPQGIGAIRNPLILEELFRRTGYDPALLFGVKVTQEQLPSLDINQMSKQIADRVVLAVRELEAEDGQDLGPMKTLIRLLTIKSFIQVVAKSSSEEIHSFIFGFKVWFSSIWYGLIPKKPDQYSADERIWMMILGKNLKADQLSRRARLLFIVYAGAILRRLQENLQKLVRKHGSRTQRFVCEFPGGQNEAQGFETLKTFLDQFDGYLDQIIGILELGARPDVAVDFETLLCQLLVTQAGLLEGIQIEIPTLESNLGDHQSVSEQRYHLRQALLGSSGRMIRMVNKFSFSEKAMGHLEPCLEIVRLLAEGTNEEIARKAKKLKENDTLESLKETVDDTPMLSFEEQFWKCLRMQVAYEWVTQGQ